MGRDTRVEGPVRAKAASVMSQDGPQVTLCGSNEVAPLGHTAFAAGPEGNVVTKVTRLIIDSTLGKGHPDPHWMRTSALLWGMVEKRPGSHCSTARHGVPELHLWPLQSFPDSATGQARGASCGLQDGAEDSQSWSLGKHRAICRI